MLFLINFFGIKDSFADFGCLSGGGINFCEKAASITGMAGGSTNLIHFDKNGIGVAIVVDMLQILDVAGPEIEAPAYSMSGSYQPRPLARRGYPQLSNRFPIV